MSGGRQLSLGSEDRRGEEGEGEGKGVGGGGADEDQHEDGWD